MRSTASANPARQSRTVSNTARAPIRRCSTPTGCGLWLPSAPRPPPDVRCAPDMNIAIIPARGGSKRIPRKNIRLFSGRPMIAYSISAARECGLFEHVIVSTEDPEIAAVAREHGAETPFVRPAELADDHATTVPVIKHGVEWVRQNLGPVERVCCIYATAPLIQVSALAAAHELLVRERVSGYVFSATAFPFPIQRAFKRRADGRVEMFEPANYYKRSQD